MCVDNKDYKQKQKSRPRILWRGLLSEGESYNQPPQITNNITWVTFCHLYPVISDSQLKLGLLVINLFALNQNITHK